jgi:hypothetical protein
MRRENFDRIIEAMIPGTNRIDAEAVLLGALREHRSCPQKEHYDCDLLPAAGSFYMTMAYHAQGHALERLMQTWTLVAKAYDKGDALDGPIHKMYDTAFTYRLLLS